MKNTQAQVVKGVVDVLVLFTNTYVCTLPRYSGTPQPNGNRLGTNERMWPLDRLASVTRV